MAKRISHRERIAASLQQLGEADDALAALGAAHELAESASALEFELVSEARKAGVSWSRIGAVYGLTKQGAQQRFNAPRKPKKRPAADEV